MPLEVAGETPASTSFPHPYPSLGPLHPPQSTPSPLARQSYEASWLSIGNDAFRQEGSLVRQPLIPGFVCLGPESSTSTVQEEGSERPGQSASSHLSDWIVPVSLHGEAICRPLFCNSPASESPEGAGGGELSGPSQTPGCVWTL